jgi:hypothetical protein
MKTFVATTSWIALAMLAANAHADTPCSEGTAACCDANQLWDAATQRCVTAQPTPVTPAQPLAAPAATPTDPAEAARMERAHFSGKRLALEIITGEATGLLTTYLLCNGSSCAGDGWGAFAADFAVTPLAVWGVGTAMGGRGTLLSSYLGASPALTPFTMPGQPNETPADTLSRIQTEAVVSSLLLPVCSALLYEVSSQVVSTRWRTEHAPAMTVQPVYSSGHVTGGAGTLSLSF